MQNRAQWPAASCYINSILEFIWAKLKNKIQPSKFEAIIGSIKHSWIRQHPIQQLEGCLEGLYFYRKKGGARELLIKEKKRIVFRPRHLWGWGNSKDFYCAGHLFLWGIDKAHMTDYLIGADQKILDWLIKTVFLGENATAIRSGIRSRFCIMGFSLSDAIRGLWFSF